MKKVLISVLFLVISTTLFSQSRLMYAWTFDDLQAADQTLKVIPSNLGEASDTAFIYLDGSHGSSDFLCAASETQLTTFGGTDLNDPRATPIAGNSLVFVNSSANGNDIILKFSMKGLKNAELSFATRGTTSGFDTHLWAWSIDGTVFTDFGVNTANTTTSFTLQNMSLSAFPEINNADSVFIRLNIDGASNVNGNNRFDNILIHAENYYDLSVLEVISPEDAVCGTMNDVVAVKIKNNSLYSVTDVNVFALVTFPDLSTELLEMLVSSIDSMQELNLSLGNISTLNSGVYTVKAYTNYEFDANTINDTINYQFSIAEVFPIPFLSEIDDLAEDWFWIKNGFEYVPENTQNNSSRLISAELDNVQNQASFFNANIMDTLDFHNHLIFDCRIIKTDYSTAYEMVEEDSLNMFISTDCGNTFALFHTINSENQVVGVDFRRIAIPLNGFIGNKAIFKWEAKTLDSNFVVQIDNIEVRNGDLWDMAVVSKVLPMNLPCGSLTDTLRAIFQNVGDGYVTDIPIAVQIFRPSPTMPPIVTYNDTIRDILAPGQQIEFTFSQTINTTIAGKYSLMFRITHPFDTLATLGHNADNVLFDSVRTVGPLVVPYYQGFESVSYVGNWDTDAQFDLTNELIYADFSAAENSAYLQSNKRFGPIVSGHSLFFDYAYTTTSGTAVQMGLQDSISVWISDDCSLNYDLIHVVSANNHALSNAMTRLELPLDSYIGSNIIVRIEMHSNTIDTRIKLDEIYIDGIPNINISGNYSVNICEGITHDITVNGSSNYEYVWFEASNPLVYLGTEQSLQVSQSGVYHVVATNGVGLIAQDSVQINIIPLPLVELNLPSEQQQLCPNASFIYILGSSPAGGAFSGPGVSVNRFYPENAGVGVHVISYSVTQNSCTNTATDTIEVFPVTDVTFSGLSDLCLNQSAIVLSQGLPAGGIYSGIGVSANEFNPQTAGVNTHLITYSYTDDNNCTFSALDTIVVKPLPNAFAGNNTSLCQGDQTTLVASGGTNYFWNTQQNTNAIIVSPSQTTTYTVTVTGMNACTNTSSVTVEVNEYPVASFTLPEDTVCLQTAAFELTGGSGMPTGGTGSYSGTGVSGTWFNPAIGLGTYAIRFTYSINGCDSSVTRPITVVNCVGIDENSEASQILILPNPVEESFSIIFPELIGNANIVICDVRGRKVFETEQIINESKKLDINSSAWTSGVYFINVQNGNRSFYQKLMKR